MIHAHNVYWNRYGYIDAREHDADIIEIDVIYHKGDVMCSHSWRPWKCLMYGKADNYFKAFERWNGGSIVFLYIELKTDDEKIVYKLVEMMKKYKNDRVFYIIGGKQGTDRESIADNIFQQTRTYCKTQWAPHFFNKHKDVIQRIEIYKNKPLWRRLNHF